MFPPDFKELLSVFDSRKAKYLLIGGYAVSLHAQPRATKHLDLLVSRDAENAKALLPWIETSVSTRARIPSGVTPT